MMKRLLSHTIEVEFIDCANCGMTFGLTADFIQRRRADGKGFHCPNGHSNTYKDNENDRIRRERDRLAQRIAERDDEIARQRRLREETERALSAQKGVATKLRKRASHGVCPCCNRTVSQMARHMASKHPGFKAEEVA